MFLWGPFCCLFLLILEYLAGDVCVQIVWSTPSLTEKTHQVHEGYRKSVRPDTHRNIGCQVFPV